MVSVVEVRGYVCAGREGICCEGWGRGSSLGRAVCSMGISGMADTES